MLRMEISQAVEQPAQRLLEAAVPLVKPWLLTYVESPSSRLQQV